MSVGRISRCAHPDSRRSPACPAHQGLIELLQAAGPGGVACTFSTDTWGIRGNTVATAIVQATCNWWGAADGPSTVGPGSGDAVTANVVFEPWLTASPPSACEGLVTGGGWIDSPPGAYSPDPSLEGRATFGFSSKYRKGNIFPTGPTEFQFNAADLNFHSSEYKWLVVTGSNFAKFKGEGTINGEPASNDSPYKFQVWAGDGTGPNGADTFRVKIWYEAGGSETVVYDNGMNQPIGGGSIVVHTAKK